MIDFAFFLQVCYNISSFSVENLTRYSHREKGEKDMKKRNKKFQAILYVILGPIVSLLAALFAGYMYFSDTFLPNMHVVRYTLYAIMFILFMAGLWALEEGEKYLKKLRRRRK